MSASLIPCPGCGRRIDSRQEVCPDCRARAEGERTILYRQPAEKPQRPWSGIPVWVWIVLMTLAAAAAFASGLLFNVSDRILK